MQVGRAALAAWLSWRGWSALDQTGIARSMNASRYQLAGPVVLGFLAVICTLEQLFPAQRRPLLARGHLLDLCYAVIGINAVDWLTHLANHRLTALWRLHAVHHSQEELSILTTPGGASRPLRPHHADPAGRTLYLDQDGITMTALALLTAPLLRRQPARIR
jgi:hypothetical protein